MEITMIDLSPLERYETPPHFKETLSRFFLGRRLSLNTAVAKIVLQCRGLSKKGQFTSAEYYAASDRLRNVFESHGARFEITGLQNLKQDQPCVIVANHMSLLETQVLPWVVGSFNPVSIVMKKSLYDSWIFHPVAVATQCISLTRKNLRADIDVIMKEGVEYLNQGRSILLFPEGTRKKYFCREEFNSLGIKLAVRAGVKVIPIALKTDFLVNGKYISDYGTLHPERKVHIHIGEALTVEGRGKKEHQVVLDFLETNLKSWGVEIKEKGDGS
ncbi:1-acyl-sn-glycerol-3-phosphate acyltransferase [Oceanispirochaeta crateris]|uniref:1-acyl-sn-glycerol-3-phosphate acyltransferase n=2 Tax=Oceanispirochaeta crateris TaxID=2518645 RepID=A0A5C1QPG8_9SPIO|nr:1-acyl-sn-glycerol-3-phosphate acyltransferase [Oceanispirochaeta crateris]